MDPSGRMDFIEVCVRAKHLIQVLIIAAFHTNASLLLPGVETKKIRKNLENLHRPFHRLTSGLQTPHNA